MIRHGNTQLYIALIISIAMIAGAAWVMFNLRSDDSVPDRAKLIWRPIQNPIYDSSGWNY